jgi:glycosyltransferase involved in cell wall biosynthesis
MRLAIDLRSIIASSEKISGVENYTLNLFNNFKNPRIDYLPFYNSFEKRDLHKALKIHRDIKISQIPNKILNLSLKFGFPKFEQLYGDFDCLFMPDLRPFAIDNKTKLAITVHDLSPVIDPEFYSLKRRLWHKVLSYSSSFKRANIIFAVSEYTKSDLVNFFNLEPNKIKVVYPGIDHNIFNTALDQRLKHKVKEKYFLPDKFILAISTIEPRKNIAALIEAFENIADAEVFLIIAGRLGWLYSETIARVNNSPKKDKIKLLGYVNEQDKPYLISQATMLCYPSFYEGFGFQPLEAFACGVPVITSAKTSMPEVCAEAALYIEPQHIEELVAAINSILQDQTLKQNLVKKGLLRAQQFSWEKCANEISNYLLALN